MDAALGDEPPVFVGRAEWDDFGGARFCLGGLYPKCAPAQDKRTVMNRQQRRSSILRVFVLYVRETNDPTV